jgi:hypothetical protein
VSYDERLVSFGLDRLELRRLRFDLVELFKIVHGFTTCNLLSLLNFTRTDVAHNTRGHRYKLIISRVYKNTFKNYFLNRTTVVWNSLPDACFQSNLITNFKCKLMNVDFSLFLHGQQ